MAPRAQEQRRNPRCRAIAPRLRQHGPQRRAKPRHALVIIASRAAAGPGAARPLPAVLPQVAHVSPCWGLLPAATPLPARG